MQLIIMHILHIYLGCRTDIGIDAARLYCMLFIIFFLYIGKLCIWNFLFIFFKGILILFPFFYNIGLVHNFLGKSSYQDTWHDKIYHLTKMHLLNKDTKYYNYNIPYLHWSTFWGKRSKADDITKIHSNTSKRLRVYHFSIF